MKAPLELKEYPRYYNTGNRLLAFVTPSKMYKIEAIGSNKNPGVTIDYYITRNMVLRHWPGVGADKGEVSKEHFKHLINKLYKGYFDKICD